MLDKDIFKVDNQHLCQGILNKHVDHFAFKIVSDKCKILLQACVKE